MTGKDLQEYVDQREREYLDREEGALRRDDERRKIEYERDVEKLKAEIEMVERKAMIRRGSRSGKWPC